MAGLGDRLLAVGLLLARLTLHLHTHPELVGRTLAWAPGEAVMMSKKFADLVESAAVVPVGCYRLKGFADPVQLHARSVG